MRCCRGSGEAAREGRGVEVAVEETDGGKRKSLGGRLRESSRLVAKHLRGSTGPVTEYLRKSSELVGGHL